MFWWCLGHVLVVFLMFRWCLGHVLVVSGSRLGGMSIMFKWCLGHVLVVSGSCVLVVCSHV